MAKREPSKPDRELAERFAKKEPPLSRKARVRIVELLADFEPRKLANGAMYRMSRRGPEIESFEEAAPRVLRRAFGQELKRDPSNLKKFCMVAEAFELVGFLQGASVHVRELEARALTAPGASTAFAQELNEIVEADGFPLYLDEPDGRWRLRIESDLEFLRRTLLANPADMAACRQGDPQVEMVVSTVQTILARPAPVIIDYGAGLGRVLVGFGSADRFQNATYVAVDEPVQADVRSLAKNIGAQFIERTRTTFLKNPDVADVIIMMNTLHHVPLADLPRQLTVLLRSLKPGGVLVIQEIGELREPEQVSVPWVIEDIIELFRLPGCVANPRSTTTRSTKTPLTHMLVHLDGEPPDEAAFAARVRELWFKMKRRALDDLKRLYAARNIEDQRRLQYVLISNANLDLNEPPPPGAGA